MLWKMTSKLVIEPVWKDIRLSIELLKNKHTNNVYKNTVNWWIKLNRFVFRVCMNLYRLFLLRENVEIKIERYERNDWQYEKSKPKGG